MKQILLYNPDTRQIEEEKVFGQGFLEYIYSKRLGLLLTNAILKRRFFSILYGNQLKKPYSRKKIADFIQKNQLNTEELLDPVESFQSFNDFFIRKLKPEARPIDQSKEALISTADSRLSVFNIQHDTVIPVKGRLFTLEQITKDRALVDKYINGLCLIFRLAPVDYHRFCFIDKGKQGKIVKLGDHYHSVNPIALESNLPVFQGNYREYCEMETENFGKILQIEVGAMGVSKIIEHFPQGCEFEKGQEKGYFEFGGSTSILIFEKDKIVVDPLIMEYSQKGIEVLVKYGATIGKKK